jgi:arsenate reductase
LYQLFGIKNCNTVSKAIKWLEEKNIEFDFVDVKKNLSSNQINSWFKNLPKPLESIMFVNQRGITWRSFSEEEKLLINSESGIIEIILKKPSVMKRPVLTENGLVKLLGFDEALYKKEFNE